MRKNNKFMQINLTAGEWIYNFFLLQLLPILYSLKGVIIFGVFPSLASVFNIFYRWIFYKEFDLSVKDEFKKFYNENFWETNKLGWITAAIGIFLGFDLYFSSQYIQNVFVHIALLLIFFVYLILACYIFIILARYELPRLRDYFRQTLLIGMAGIIPSVAAVLSIIVVLYLFQHIPFLPLFFGIPILIGPITWFAVQGIQKVENVKHEEA